MVLSDLSFQGYHRWIRNQIPDYQNIEEEEDSIDKGKEKKRSGDNKDYSYYKLAKKVDLNKVVIRAVRIERRQKDIINLLSCKRFPLELGTFSKPTMPFCCLKVIQTGLLISTYLKGYKQHYWSTSRNHY